MQRCRYHTDLCCSADAIAVHVAQLNVKSAAVVQSDCYGAFRHEATQRHDATPKFDCIVSNPPVGSTGVRQDWVVKSIVGQ